MESEKPATKVSKGYMVFLIVLMGLVSQLDSWLSLIEATAIPEILNEFWPSATNEVARSEFALLQGLFGILVFAVFFIGWFGDAYGRKKGIQVLVLTMGIPAILIVFLSVNVYIFLLLYSLVIMGTTSNLWEIPISEEAPASKRGLYGSLAFLIGVIPLYAILGNRIIYAVGWRWGYGIMFILMVVVLLMTFGMKETQRWKDSAATREKRLGVMEAIRKIERKDRKYILLATVVYLVWTISFKMATSWGGEYFQTVQGLTPEAWTSVLTVAGLLLPVSALISGILLDKVGRNVVLVMGSLGSVISLVGLGITGLQYFYWGAFFFMAAVLAWIYVYLAEIFPTEIRTTSVGVCVTGARFGYVVGPLISSALLAIFPIMDGFWIIAGLLMIVPLFTLLAKPLETKGKELEAIEMER
ncbi:MAG: MFS transporter [Candidatus Thorarchaeota archaeon]